MRASGEGSVYQRADGRWVAQIEAGYTRQGNRRRLRRVRDTRRAAVQALHALQRDAAAGIPADLDTQTLGDYLAGWLAGLDRAPKTIAAYRGDINHVAAHLGHVPLAKLDPQHVRRMLAALELAPKSKLNVRTTLHTAMQDAVRDRRLQWNPVSVVERPRVSRSDVHPLSAAQARTLIDSGGVWAPLWALLAGSGLRLAEALGLTWRRVDGDVLRVRHQLRRVDGEYRLADLKNRKVRDVPAPRRVVEQLADQRKAVAAAKLAAESWPDRWGLVFPSPAGRPLTDTQPRNHLAAQSQELLGVRVTPHLLRHTAATLMIAKGVPLAMVSDILGHSSIQVTKDMYGHLDVEQLRPAAAAMDDLLG